MKLLFVDFQHADQSHANIHCVEILRKNLHSIGISSDVLTFRLSHTTAYVQEDSYGKVISANTWMRFTTAKKNYRSKIDLAFRAPHIFILLALHKIIGGRHVHEKLYAPLACRGLKKKLETLCKTSQYDWVVAMCYPFCIQQTAASANLNSAKLALYYLDPYTANHSHSAQNAPARLREECATAANADLIFISPEHLNDWRDSPLSTYLKKVRTLPYPNLSPYEGIYITNQIKLHQDSINLVYIGTLCDGIRYPVPMFYLFHAMLKQEPRLRLYVIGQIHGSEVRKQIREAQNTLGSQLDIYPVIPFPEAMDLIRSADVVINLGNFVENQMPSKLLEYIAAGRPILNICPNNPCNTEPYISQYPLALQCYTDALQTEADIQYEARKAVSFIRQNGGKTLDWDQIQSAMKGYTSIDVAKQLLEDLRSVEGKG